VEPKQIIHLYDGSMDGSFACSKCGKTAWNILHIRNGNGITCDAVNWPCACGSFHYDGEMDQKIHMANTNYSEWLQKVAAPGYVLTKDDKDILEALES
jgi:hypothetical protein